VLEVLGIGIFFASFRDSIRMLGNFDDSRQQVLKQKRRMMELVGSESLHVLGRAKTNVDKVRGSVLDALYGSVTHYVQEVFLVVLPALEKETKWISTKLLIRIASHLKHNLAELDNLAISVFKSLAEDHPLYKEILESLDFGTCPQWKSKWDDWINRNCQRLGADAQPPNANLRLTMEHTANRRTSAGLAELVILAADIASGVLWWVQLLLTTPDKLEQKQQNVMQVSEERVVQRRQQRRRHAGCGKPPWHTSCCGCSFCMPRSFGLALQCISCVFRCCCCEKCEQAAQQSLCYRPPKQVSLGFMWITFYTKMHERLLTGLVTSVIYCVVFSAFIYGGLNQTWTSEGWYDLLKEIAWDSLAVCALLCNIPCQCICLYHIDRLDAVMETLESIWELEEMLDAVKAFNSRMETVSDQVVLLGAIEDRVDLRLDMVIHYARRMSELCAEDTPQLLSEATDQLTQFLDFADKTLLSADEWLALPMEDKKACSGNVKEVADNLKSRRFQIARGPNTVADNNHSAIPTSLASMPAVTFTRSTSDT